MELDQGLVSFLLYSLRIILWPLALTKLHPCLSKLIFLISRVTSLLQITYTLVGVRNTNREELREFITDVR